jgi:hypothetical protein
MKITQQFRVKSLQGIDTDYLDLDKGVVRISQQILSKFGNRNILIRLSNQSGGTITRIARAFHGEDYSDDQIAIQFEDRLELGLSLWRSAMPQTYELTLETVPYPLGLIAFNFKHTSPFVRLQTALSFWFAVIGVAVGFVLGLAIP